MQSPLASENLTITWKRFKVGGKLVLITNRKAYMSFRLVLKSMILSDLERRNGPYFVLFHVFSRNSVAFEANCVKVVEDIPKLCVTEM